jgi:hypothetical protein
MTGRVFLLALLAIRPVLAAPVTELQQGAPSEVAPS